MIGGEEPTATYPMVTQEGHLLLVTYVVLIPSHTQTVAQKHRLINLNTWETYLTHRHTLDLTRDENMFVCEPQPISMTVHTLTHTHMHRIIEPFLLWSKREDMKSNKSCMVAGGRQCRHGDVQMKRDESACVSVCVRRTTRRGVTERNKANVPAR